MASAPGQFDHLSAGRQYFQLDGQIALVTGASSGLGRHFAHLLAANGCIVGIAARRADRLDTLKTEIEAAGGRAVKIVMDVTDAASVETGVNTLHEAAGPCSILVNNAGILRDKTFAKMSIDDFKLVLGVHLMGSVNCTKAAWNIMREQSYGRVVMTTSSSGMYGNFGQSNYGAAKMALVGFMNTLVLEGKKYGIHVNTLAPTAGTRMLEDIIQDDQILDMMSVESVTAGLITLCDKDAPNRSILCAGGGGYAATHILETDGVYLPPEKQTPEEVRANIDSIEDAQDAKRFTAGFDQTNKFIEKAIAYAKANS